MHLGLALMESSLHSPEFPFLGGAFGATAWLCTPKQGSGQCHSALPFGSLFEQESLTACVSVPQQMKLAAVCTPRCWQRCGSCRMDILVAQGECSFLGCRRGEGWWPLRAWL